MKKKELNLLPRSPSPCGIEYVLASQIHHGQGVGLGQAIVLQLQPGDALRAGHSGHHRYIISLLAHQLAQPFADKPRPATCNTVHNQMNHDYMRRYPPIRSCLADMVASGWTFAGLFLLTSKLLSLLCKRV